MSSLVHLTTSAVSTEFFGFDSTQCDEPTDKCMCYFVCVSRAEKQRELARKGSLKNGNTVGSPVNQQPKKNNVMARTR